jgi:undecaprenyl phosphate-alpha-L-ara4N flippase subunit ArnE
MSFAVVPAVTGCVIFETGQQVAFSLSGRSSSYRWHWLIAGAICYLIELAFWFWVLKLLPLGIAVPLISANYITVSLASHFLFRESLNMRHWLGIGCIVGGIAMIARGM